MARKFAVNQLRKMWIVGQFFECPPILLAGLFAEFLAHRGQIQAVLLFGGSVTVVFMVMIATGVVPARTVQDVKVLFVWVIAHSFR
jgi:hypothetical protein